MHLVHGTDNEAEMDVEFITDGSYNNWEKTTNTGGNIYSHFCLTKVPEKLLSLALVAMI
jgi:hypothetical protein